MNNSQISARIKRLSAMMTLLDDNPHKIRAFEKAARIISEHPEEMGVLIDEDRLKAVSGIGDTLAHIILYYAKSGGPGFEKELEDRLPTGLPVLLDLKGLSLKKVQTLWLDHEISNITLLEEACRSNTLAGWSGFGSKLEQLLLKSIAFKARHVSDFHLDLALKVSQLWHQKLASLPSVKRVELTGRLRRRDDLIRSVDFIVEADLAVLKNDLIQFQNFDFTHIEPISLKDDTGLPIQLWISSSSDFQLRQLVLTGGSAYLEKINSALRVKGLTHDQGSRADLDATGLTEATLCEVLHIQWIEPELRDNFDSFPPDRTLIQVQDIKGVIHAHSTWSDGKNSLEQMVRAARDLGYQYLGISDHSQAAYYANGLKPDRVKKQWDHIDKLNDQYPDIHIFKGIEADILSDGRLDYDEELLAGFDLVIASIHSHFHLDRDKQTNRIIRALQSPFTTILGHPTGRMLLSREGYDPDLPSIIEAAAEYDKIIEINTTPKRLDLDWRYAALAREKGVKFSINPDAHSSKGLETIPLGVSMARKGGLGPEDIINTLSTSELTNYLRKHHWTK
ncbi:MAG: PHP domain-containing protein [Candidatus Marinimicrobia bacterium]|nr:PHP domain-containing protein [Candidatus Neomarinimicrobiota bacterium]